MVIEQKSDTGVVMKAKKVFITASGVRYEITHLEGGGLQINKYVEAGSSLIAITPQAHNSITIK